MSRVRRNLIVVLGVVGLAVPTAAVAHHKEGHTGGQGKSKPHTVAYVFKGTYAGEGTVAVTQGNSRVRKGGLVGQTVAFDLTDARIVVADTNGDLASDLNDVVVGDKVLVKAKLPKSDPGAQPFDASKLVDQTNPPPES